jgi:protoheme IX farnesyltransferase
MKLRVVELLLVTTLPALFLAARGLPPAGTTIATLVGGTLAAGAANAYNMIIEVDSDRLMARTSKRPLVNNQISKKAAFLFAAVITVLALVIFAIWTTTLATIVTAIAILFYVFIYTIILKRRTSQNIVWGGIAGCLPVLIGWAAITNSLSLTAWLFFFLIFFWTPPHFWALAIKYRDDYAAAGIPMLPVVSSMKSVRNQMWFHTTGMIICSFAVLVSAGLPFWTYFISAGLAIGFVMTLMKIQGEDSDRAAAKLFHWSITYLSIYSLLLVIGILLK